MTPESLGRELADFLRRPDPEAEFELRGDPVVVTAILDAERHLALVDMAGATNVPVPYGVGQPQVGRQYLMESTPRGDRWIKSAGIPWCRTWTLDADFNEDGATFTGEMRVPAAADRLSLFVYPRYGTGIDGAATFTAGIYNLNAVSICGRATPDAAYVAVGTWDAGFVAPAPAGLAVGDEVLIYVAQAPEGASEGDVDLYVGLGEFHRVSALGSGGFFYDDYVHNALGGLSSWSIYAQRVPNYTTLEQTGSFSFSTYLTAGSHAAGTGTGVVAIRATSSLKATCNVVGLGFAGGGTTAYCHTAAEGLDAHVIGGDGMRKWRPHTAGTPDHRTGGYGGGGNAGEDGDCTTDQHSLDHIAGCTCNGGSLYDAGVSHHARSGSAGGGGGHANQGSPTGTQAGMADGGTERIGTGILSTPHATSRRLGAGGGAIGQSDLLTNGAIFRAMFGGGGGGGGEFDTGSPGPGGAGGGLVFLAAPTITATGGIQSTPTLDVNGADGASRSGGGAAGSIVVIGDTVAGHFNAAHFGGGRGGAGGSGINNNTEQLLAGGHGAVGRVHVRYTTDAGFSVVGSAFTEGHPLPVGCWASAIYESSMLEDEDATPLAAGLRIEPTTLRADWTLDSGGLKPTFYLVGGNQPDLSDGVTYPTTTPFYWQDGGTHDINDDTELDLSPYVLAPALYWRVFACLDSGADTGDTPTVLSVALCGVAS